MISTEINSPGSRPEVAHAASPGAEIAAHYPALRQYARGLTRNACDIDDLVQECVIRALTKFDKFEPGTNLRGWLRVILHNVFLDGLRRSARARRFRDAYAVSGRGPVTGPDQLARLELHAVEHALGELPAIQRDTFTMVAIDGLTYEEAARRSGVPVGTVRSRVSRARAYLAISSYGATPQKRLPRAA